MNKTRLIAAAVAALALSAPAVAVDVDSAFNVRVTLTSACQVNTTAGNIDLTYTGFQGSAATNTGLATFDCTRGFAPTSVSFDDNGADKLSDAPGATATGSGVVAGLRYTITATHSAPDSSAGAAATASADGTADERAYEIEVTIPADQPGTASVGQQTHARTLTITY